MSKKAAFAVFALVAIVVAIRYRETIITEAGRGLAVALSYPAVDMKISQAGIEKIKQREGGFMARSYPDASGRSIGYGHYITFGEKFNEPISEALATSLLLSDIQLAESAVQGGVTVPISQDMYDALVSFTYNVGTSAFRNSTLLKKLNKRDYAGAAESFAAWNKTTQNGQKVILAALIQRRAQEAAQFTQGGMLA
jgi:lysozyme